MTQQDKDACWVNAMRSAPCWEPGDGAGVSARDRVPQRTVAIKMLGHPYAQEPAMEARFTQEARSAAGLSHPNVVAVFDGGSVAGMHYPVMEYVEAQCAAAAPTSRCRSSTAWRQGRRAGRRAPQGPDKQVRRAVDGFRQVVERGDLVVGRPCLPDVRTRLVSGPPSFANPSREQSIQLMRSQGWMARTRMASAAGGPGGGGGGQVVGPARRRVPGPPRAAARAA
jgi:hypothetical protein